MTEQMAETDINICDNDININGITVGINFEDNNRDNDCRQINFDSMSNNVNRLQESPNYGDNRSKPSSRASIKSNGSEDKISVTSHKSEHKSFDPKQRRVAPIKDQYCWDCHRVGVDYSCKTCLRSYHQKCPSLKRSPELQSCPECIGIMRAEEGTNPSGCMKRLNGNVNRMAEILEYTIVTVKAADKKTSFHFAVNTEEYPDYHKYIVNPMDLSLVEDNVKNKTYASTNSFLADIKWIYHNCVVFNSGTNNALISEAKNIIRVAKQECEEIEICPDCYLNYYTLDEESYFAAVCERPHAIVWAKLKGHPSWPAKVVRYNEIRNEVDVRFFGTHDKCWLKPDKCQLMSRKYPNLKKPAKFDANRFNEAIKDLNRHLDYLEKSKPNLFKYYDKHTVFTVDRLYLSRDHNSVKEDSQQNTEVIENPKKVLNSYNGIPFKTLKVNASTFDMTPHIIHQKVDPEMRSPPIKRFKKGSPNKLNQNRCFSNAIPIREELSSSVESDQSFNDSSKIDRSFSSQNSFDQNSKNDFNENHLNSSNSETNDLNRCPKGSPVMSRSKTVTVSGKSSEILNLNNNINETFNDELSETSNKNLTQNSMNENDWKKSDSSSKLKSKSKIDINDDIMKKIKTLEMKKRKLEEELNEANNKITVLEEEKDELKKTNQELVTSISDIKKKQWCTNCSKEGILPCCWNTCYCSVECQHQHWPIHSKSCRRRQQQQTTRN